MKLKKYFTAIFILIMTYNCGRGQGINIKYLESIMVKVNDSLYVSKYETSNAEYREFFKAKKKEHYYPDTANWVLVRDKVRSFKGHYFDNTVFDRYPVVCVNPNQAKCYCEWLTDMYNTSPLKKYKKVVFRLPTHNEWLLAARGAEPEDTRFPWKGNSLRLNDTRRMANYLAIEDACIKSEMFSTHLQFMCLDGLMKQAFPESVTNYSQTAFGVHNICGNAAEMVSDKEYAMGGSWLSTGYYLRIDIQDFEPLPIPSPMVGFRIFMEVVEQ